MKSKPGIPLGAPLGPVLTYFSVVVVIVRVGEIGLKSNRLKNLVVYFFIYLFFFNLKKLKSTHLPSETILVGFAATRYST